MFSKPLMRNLVQVTAAVIVFTLTFFLLFLRSRSAFVAALPPPAPAAPSPDQAQRIAAASYVYWNFHSTEIDKMIRDLAAEREALRAKEADLAAEEARVKSEKAENERLKEEITRSRKELSDFIIRIQAGEAERIQKEVVILNNLDPASIVAVLNEKDDRDVVRLLAQMKPDAVAAILEAMMAQTSQPDKPTPQKHAANLLDLLRRYRADGAK
jgi:flagellar motility protein MotE (MotC chaperone)